MTPSPLNLLGDTGESEAVGGQTTKTLADMAQTPASELFVLEREGACWVKKWVRKFRITLAFALGILLAVQVGGVFFVRAKLREEVRASVTEVLKERKLISSAEQTEAVGPVALTSQQGAVP